MVVLVERFTRLMYMRLASHAQMNSEPVLCAKAKAHLFAVSRGSGEYLANEVTLKCFRIDATEYSLRGVEIDACDTLRDSGLPLFTLIFDFGKFRHLA